MKLPLLCLLLSTSLLRKKTPALIRSPPFSSKQQSHFLIRSRSKNSLTHSPDSVRLTRSTQDSIHNNRHINIDTDRSGQVQHGIDNSANLDFGIQVQIDVESSLDASKEVEVGVDFGLEVKVQIEVGVEGNVDDGVQDSFDVEGDVGADGGAD